MRIKLVQAGLASVCTVIAACAPEPYQPQSMNAGAAAASAPSGAVAAPSPALPPAPIAAPTPSAAPAASRPNIARYALEGICEVKPRTLVQIKSQANGEVTAVRAEVGDTVRRGQVLVEISPRTLNEQIARNQLARERVLKRIELINIQLATQRREAKVLEELYSEAGNIKNRVSIRERETELESAQLELKELELRQRELERELRYTQIQSPADGIIVKRTVEPGQIVNAAGSGISGGDSLLELADKTELQLDCAVHAEDADLIEQRVPLVLQVSRNQGITTPITVQRIAPMLDNRGSVPQLRFTARFAQAVPPQVLLGARYTLTQAK